MGLCHEFVGPPPRSRSSSGAANQGSVRVNAMVRLWCASETLPRLQTDLLPLRAWTVHPKGEFGSQPEALWPGVGNLPCGPPARASSISGVSLSKFRAPGTLLLCDYGLR